jgi:lysophospholipase L1-like esterase
VRSRRLRPVRRLVLDSLGPRPSERLERWDDLPTVAGAAALIGDSLAAEFPTELLTPIALPLLIRGWPGETIGELHARVGETLRRSPSVLIIQSGTNDVLRGRPRADIARDYHSLLRVCRDALPRAVILVLSLPPISPRRVPVSEVRNFNHELRQLTGAFHARYLDSFAELALPGGAPRQEVTRDGVHLSGAGYAAIAAILRRAVEETLPTTGRSDG